jgi:hypothetical protein
MMALDGARHGRGRLDDRRQGAGEIVLLGLQRADPGLGFVGGLAIVLLAILLDRRARAALKLEPYWPSPMFLGGYFLKVAACPFISAAIEARNAFIR